MEALGKVNKWPAARNVEQKAKINTKAQTLTQKGDKFLRKSNKKCSTDAQNYKPINKDIRDLKSDVLKIR